MFNNAEPVKKRCACCGGPFGLIRRHRRGRQFCSMKCLERYDDALKRVAQDKSRWRGLFSQQQPPAERQP